MSAAEAPAAEAVPRKAGRPRDERADRAILEATLELTRTCGLAGLHMDAVAAHAGVSKATIYRRWASKEALVLDAWAAVVQPSPVPDTGSLRRDLADYFDGFADKVASGSAGEVLPHLLTAARTNPEIAGMLQDYVRNRREPIRLILQRARRRGELDHHVDVELVIDALVGPLMYRVLVTGGVVDARTVRRLHDLVLAGLGVA